MEKFGFLYEILSEISVILQLITLKKKIDNNILYNAIQRIKEDTSYYSITETFEIVLANLLRQKIKKG